MKTLKDIFYIIRFEFYKRFDKRFAAFHTLYMTMPIGNAFLNQNFTETELDYLVVIQKRDSGEISPIVKLKLKQLKVKTVKS